MNARTQVATIHSLTAARDNTEQAYHEADVLANSAAVAARDAKRTAAADPCDHTKAQQQAAEQAYTDALAARESLKDELRRKNEAVRVFCFRRKTVNGKGQTVRL